MLNEKIYNALNEQIAKEALSVALYEKMSVCCEVAGYVGVSKYFMKKADEEKTHYRRFISYVQDRAETDKGEVVIPAVLEPKFDFKDLLTTFALTLKHEKMISESINEIAGLCVTESDFMTMQELWWFLHEQVEEEKSVLDALSKLELTPTNNYAQFDTWIESI
jgi:ferritin